MVKKDSMAASRSLLETPTRPNDITRSGNKSMFVSQTKTDQPTYARTDSAFQLTGGLAWLFLGEGSV